MIELTRASTQMMFVFIIIAAPLILQISKYCKTNIGREFCIFISFMILFVPLALRTNGIDQDNYLIWYNYPFTYLPYNGSPEPLFALLLYVAHYLVGDFQIVYIVPAFIFLFGIYKYILTRCDDYYSALIFIIMSLYIYMCGLVRYAAALGLLFWAMSDFTKKRRYFILNILAILFHYSAVFGVIIYAFYHSKRRLSLKNIFILLASIWGAVYIISRYSSTIPFLHRYIGYITPDFNAATLRLYLIVLPALILYLLYINWFDNALDDGLSIRNLLILLIIVMGMSTFLQGTYRICWMLYAVVAKVYSDIPRAMIGNNNDTSTNLAIVLVYKIFLTIIAIIYVIFVLLNSVYIEPNLIPFGFCF